MREGMEKSAQGALDDLHRFEARHRPEGLFLRYCRARLRGLWVRQGMIVVAVLGVWAQIDLRSALLIVTLLGTAEIIDTGLLWYVPRRLQGRLPSRRTMWLACATALLQGVAVAVCCATVWLGAPNDARFFVTACVVLTTVDAVLLLPLAGAATLARISVEIVVLALLFGHDFELRHDAGPSQSPLLFDVLAAATLMVTGWFVMQLINRTYRRRIEIERALLQDRHKLIVQREAMAEKELHARRLALVAQNANDSILITGPDGTIDWVNATFSRLTGYSFGEAFGQHPRDLLNGHLTDGAAIEALRHARIEHLPIRIEIEMLTKSGRLIWMETSHTPIFLEDGSYAMTIAVEREITEMKQREADLARAREAAEAAARAKTRFLATMSHEIRTPMNGVIGMADLLWDTELTAGQRSYVGTMVESGRALLSIINDVLDLTRLDAGKPVITQSPFCLTDCVRGSIELLRPLALERGLNLVLEMPASPLPLFVGDGGRVRQIVLNLVGNALKFTEAGSVRVRVAEADAALPGGTPAKAIGISVTDTGIGIGADRLDLIFDSFTQADSETTRKFGGTGLGLTISRLLATEMGGTLSVVSEPGQGSRFDFDLPLPVAPTAPVRETPAPVETSGVAGHRILIAEDNRTNALIVRKMLEDTGAELVFVTDGAAAVEAAGAARFDLILMDLSMPGMDGLQATREIRARETGIGTRTAVIALTANAFEEDRLACEAAGFDDFLTKPVTRRALRDCIGRHVASDEVPIRPTHLQPARLKPRSSQRRAVVPALASDGTGTLLAAAPGAQRGS